MGAPAVSQHRTCMRVPIGCASLETRGHERSRDLLPKKINEVRVCHVMLVGNASRGVPGKRHGTCV